MPPGVCTSTISPDSLPMSALPMGEEYEMRPALMSASSSPTICQVAFSPSLSMSTVAPNTQRPSASTSFGSTIWALASLASMSRMRASIMPWWLRAASYSAFSDRSPCERASAMACELRGRSTFLSCCSSLRSSSAPRRVMGAFISGDHRLGARLAQARVQVLQAVGLERGEVVLHAGAGGFGAGDRGVVGDAARQRGGADRFRVGVRGARRLGGVDDEVDLAVLDHVDDVRPALGHLVHLRHRDAVRAEDRGGAARGEEREAEVGEIARHLHRGELVAVAHADEGLAAGR